MSDNIKGTSKKSAQVFVRIEPEVKEKAEEILQKMGITGSEAVNILYHQIIIQGGLPFPVTTKSMTIEGEKIKSAENKKSDDGGYRISSFFDEETPF